MNCLIAIVGMIVLGADPSGGPATAPTLKTVNRAEGAASLAAAQEPALRLQWSGPTTAKLRQFNSYGLSVRNVGAVPVQHVLVRVRIPGGMTCGQSEPKAAVQGKVLVWELGALQARQEQVLHMKLAAEQKGDLVPQAWVSFTGSSLMHVQVREPKLALAVRGPAQTLAGATTVFTLSVSNCGDAPAERVRLHADLTKGLELGHGQKIDFDIDSLAPGQTFDVSLTCTAKQSGIQQCQALAEANDGLRVKDAVVVRVAVPRLQLRLSGPALRYLGRKALYAIKVSNPGDAQAANAMVSHVVPEGFKVLAASDGGRYDEAAHTVSWSVGDIKPGANREVKLEVQAVDVGVFTHKVSAAAANVHADAEMTTRVEGRSVLVVEMRDSDDPIEVGSDTRYEVRVANDGSKVETDVKLIARIPDKMEFKSATGPGRFHEEGKNLIFEPIEKLAPKAAAVFRITVRALAPGTVRFQTQISSATLTEPVVKMEATHIYADAAEGK